MKKYLVLFLVPLMFACGPSKKEVAMQAKIDSLQAADKMKEEAINDFMSTIDAVEENLAQIKEKESLISLAANEGGQSAKNRINEDVNTIYALMKENQDKVTALEKKLKNSRYKNSKLAKTVATLKKRVEEQAKEIAKLQRDLAQKNIVIEGLSEDIETLSKDVDNLAKKTEAQQEEIAEKTEALNTAYYVVGTKKELLANKVIDREGGILGLGKTSTLSKNLNTEYFTKIDLTKLTKVPIGAKKVELISSHPEGSFEFEGTEPIGNLVVKDASKFWSMSKYLVIQIRK